MDSTHQNKASKPAVVHSTHSFLETFDQATREQQQQETGSSGDINNYAFSTHHPSTDNRKSSSRRGSLEAEANSAVQLDRDMHQSRRMADEDRQKASGN
ncbi:hypothetical protein BGZ99_005839 [Dissophora globulifera]|uniref:Uncharacterized protein n=1 Tax=Dissophora globulifera TaxID=979702 RepID=A0A9P6URX1_9FUNG|nr:hypothetical protein BGZ99_005839 [Dissophora globulifera]